MSPLNQFAVDQRTQAYEQFFNEVKRKLGAGLFHLLQHTPFKSHFKTLSALSSTVIMGGTGACIGIVGGPLGIGLGTSLGSIAGAFFGWRGYLFLEQFLLKKFDHELNTFLSKDPRLQPYVCQLTKRLFEDAVATSNGEYFESKALEEHLRSVGTHPILGTPLSPIDVSKAPDIQAKLALKIGEILEEDSVSISSLDQKNMELLVHYRIRMLHRNDEKHDEALATASKATTSFGIEVGNQIAAKTFYPLDVTRSEEPEQVSTTAHIVELGEELRIMR